MKTRPTPTQKSIDGGTGARRSFYRWNYIKPTLAFFRCIRYIYEYVSPSSHNLSSLTLAAYTIFSLFRYISEVTRFSDASSIWFLYSPTDLCWNPVDWFLVSFVLIRLWFRCSFLIDRFDFLIDWGFRRYTSQSNWFYTVFFPWSESVRWINGSI